MTRGSTAPRLDTPRPRAYDRIDAYVEEDLVKTIVMLIGLTEQQRDRTRP